MSANALENAATDEQPAPSDRASKTNAGHSRDGGPRWLPARPGRSPRREPGPHVLDPDRLPDHIDQLFRAAWGLCGSRHDAEDLVQETFAKVLRRPRLLRNENEIGYLLRALRNTHASRYRAAAGRPATCQLLEDDLPACEEGGVAAREIMEAVARVAAPYRDAVIAVDLLGLSYREAARSLRTREATITSRLHRGRQQLARELIDDTATATRS